MDCLIGVIKKVGDEEKRKNGLLITAQSLDYNISANGKTAEEASKKLEGLLIGHIKSVLDREITLDVHNEESLEELMRYCAENGFPEALPDIEIGYGLRLRCYDLTKVAVKV